jgi:hypothetical protein
VGISIVVAPNFFRKIFYYVMGLPTPQSVQSEKMNDLYLVGIFFAFVIPVVGGFISLLWKLHQEINSFVNLLYWSLFMFVSSVVYMIISEQPSKASNYQLILCPYRTFSIQWLLLFLVCL